MCLFENFKVSSKFHDDLGLALKNYSFRLIFFQLCNFNFSFSENLKQMWTAKLKEYELEEQGLRVMLSEANLETIKSKKHLEEEALNSWKTLLFGTEDSHQFYSDFNELLLIRYISFTSYFFSFVAALCPKDRG